MIQRGLFVIFSKTHNMKQIIFKNSFWNVGHSLLRAYPWSVNGNFDEVVKKSMLKWVEIKNINVEFWPFIDHILKPLGSILQVDNSRITLLHLNMRALVALEPGVFFPYIISLNLEGEYFSWEISLLGN